MLRFFSMALISILAMFLSFVSPYLLHAEGEITDTTFTIDLAPMDPLGSGQKAGGAQGVGVLNVLLGNVADLLLFTIPLVAAISLLVAGYFYIFSAGDSEKTSKAKTIIKWNIIAIVLAFLSYGIINLIALLFT